MTFTFEHFMISISILILIVFTLVILYFLGFLIFRSYCKMNDIPNKTEVEIIIYDVLEKERNRTYPNSSNALKSENKLKSTKSGRK